MRTFVCERYPIDKLPRDLHPQLPSGRTVRVVIEDDITDEEWRAELDAELAKGLASLDAGISYSAEEVLAHIEAQSRQQLDAAE